MAKGTAPKDCPPAYVAHQDWNALDLPPEYELFIGLEVPKPEKADKAGGQLALAAQTQNFEHFQPDQEFGIEGDGTPTVVTDGERKWDDPPQMSRPPTCCKKLDFGELAGKTLRVRAYRNNVVSKTGKKPEYVADLYPTEETYAEIDVFQGDHCLTGNKKWDVAQDYALKVKPGVVKILVRLAAMESQIRDLILDGVVHVKDGEQKVSTAA